MTSNNAHPTVLSIPRFSLNHYQTLLHAGLEETGCRVVSPRGFQVLLFALFGRWDVLHIQWIDRLVWNPVRWRRPVRWAGLAFLFSLAKLTRRRIVWTLHQFQPHDRDVFPSADSVNRLMVRIVDRVIVHYPSIRDEAMARLGAPPAKLRVIPHGNYLDAYPNTIDRVESRRRLGVPADAFVYLFFGLVRGYKGVEELISAFTRMEDPDAILLIVGRLDPDSPRERQRYQTEDRRVRFVFRFIADEEIQLYMNASDVVVLPFRKIVTSGSAMLAMTFSRPCILPRMGSLPEAVPSAGAFFFDWATPDALFTALIQARRSAADLPEMGRACFEAAKASDWPTIARATRSCYLD